MKKILEKIHIPTWLGLLLATVLILRIPSFFEPYSYGDEMVYLTLGEAVRQGITLYKGIYDNKPPLLYLLAALAGNLFWFKAILAFWNLATIVIFWHLAKALFPKNDRLQKIATLIFGFLTTIPLLEGNIVNAELFLIGPIMAGFLILLTRKFSPRNLFGAGILFSVATLFKIPAAFDIPAIVVYWLIESELKKDKIREIIKNTAILTLGFATPIILTFVWFFFAGALREYLQAAFLQNIGYLSSFRPGDVTKSFLVRNLPLLIRAGLVVVAAGLLFFKRKKLPREFIFICLWLGFGLFAVTLSERPYPHYLIQVVPEISLLLAILISQKSLVQSLAIIPLTITFFVPVFYHFYYYPTTPYYLRFVKFITGRIDKSRYLAGFGADVARNYEVANFLVNSSRKTDKVFVTGDSPAIYALSHRLPPGKFVAEYHIFDFSSTKEEAKVLANQKARFIVILPGSRPFPEIIPILRKNYIQMGDISGAEIWSLKTAGVNF